MILKKTIALFIFLLTLFPRVSLAQHVGDSIPDFKTLFGVLTKNCTVYNAYNDSIFLIHDHDAWVNFFRHRSIKNHQIFLASQEVFRTVNDYFSQPASNIPDEAYREFYRELEVYADSKKGDPFTMLNFCNILERYYQHCPDSLNFSNKVNLWQAENYNNLYYLGNDSTYRQKSYEYLLKNLDESRRRFPLYEPCRLEALSSLIVLNWLHLHFHKINEFKNILDKFDEAMQSDEARKGISQANLEKFKETRKMVDESLVRNVFMYDPAILDKVVADSLMTTLVNKNLQNPHLSSVSYLRTLAMQVYLKQISASEAIESSLKRYRKVRKKALTKRLTDSELTEFLRPNLTFFYLLDKSDYSFAKKRHITKWVCKDIETAYHHRKDQQEQNSYVSMLNTLVTYPRVIKYLTPKERIRFLNSLTVATQVTTYAHSVHVSKIAEALTNEIVDKEPQLLVGMLGCHTQGAVKKHKKEFLNFIHDAAMYHDLGKNSIISVVNNDYRPLTDEEYHIIKQHPRLGLQYLDLAPSLAKYHDTTLGHHKWYNGKGGYPADFDNTKSPVRTLIDIVMLSDCMQAATEKVGRNYKADKTFDSVMNEFRRDAGTMYNPDLVRFIDEQPKLAKKLAKLLDKGWVEIYFRIYQRFF